MLQINSHKLMESSQGSWRIYASLVVKGLKLPGYTIIVYFQLWNHHIKILVVCMQVLRKRDIWGAGLDWWRATFILSVLFTVCAWSQGDAIGEQQLRGAQSGSSMWSGCNRGAAAEADAIKGSSWSGRNQGEVQSDHARLVLTWDTEA